MKMKLAYWPVLIVSGEFSAGNNEGVRLRELVSELENNSDCSVVCTTSYEDALEIFCSRADNDSGAARGGVGLYAAAGGKTRPLYGKGSESTQSYCPHCVRYNCALQYRSHNCSLSQLTCKEDGCRAVRTTDDGNSCCSFVVESESNRSEVSCENTELSCCTEQEALRVCDKRTKVCHRTYTHKDKGR